MSHFGYGERDSRHNDSRPTRTLYPELMPEKRIAASKLFDLSSDNYDDFENLSDFENAAHGRTLRHTPEYQTAAHNSQRTSGSNYAPPVSPKLYGHRRAGRNMSMDEPDFQEPKTIATRMMDRGDSFNSSLPEESQEKAEPLAYVSQRSSPPPIRRAGLARYTTPAASRGSIESMQRSQEGSSDQETGEAKPPMHAAGLRGLPQETPAYRPPLPQLSQSSAGASRWKHRRRLGLGKPRRRDPSAASDDNADEPVGSPPTSLDFSARSPPRSPLPIFGTEGGDSSPRHLLMAIDDTENAFTTPARSRHSSKTPGVSNAGQGAPKRTSAVANGSFEISDVSMHSNSRTSSSRAQSPVADEMGRVQAGSHSGTRVSFNDVELPRSAASSSQGDSARRQARSPSTMQRTRSMVVAPRADSSPVENIRAQRSDYPDVSPRQFQHHSPNYIRQQQQQQQQQPQGRMQGRANSTSSSHSQHGQPRREIGYDSIENNLGSSRSLQLDRAYKDTSPQYHTPRDRQRATSNSMRSSNSSGEVIVQSNVPRTEDSRKLTKRAQSQGPGYISPRSSARRGLVESNFDVFMQQGPDDSRAAQETAKMDMSSNRRSAEQYVSPGAQLLQSQKSTVLPIDRQFQTPVQPASEVQQLSNQQQQEQQERQGQQSQQSQPRPQPPSSEMPPPALPHQQSQSQSQSQQHPVRTNTDSKRALTVNGHTYQKISITGRGGSSKVYKAMSLKHEIFAIKRVSFSRADPQAIEGYVNEILLLRKFRGNPHIIQLFDAEINKERGLLHMVMEFGETDLANVLKRHGSKPLGMNMIRLYWEQMLRAAQAIHEERVVHADLKPANYLLVKGSLKLIDFGIAKAIGNDTTNIHRENQIGTVNYMSPEAIKETNMEGGARVMKLGRASDIWSLGIILYQMCYGRTPFAQLALFKKLASIPDPNFRIPFPRYMAGCTQVGTENDPNSSPEPAMPDGSPKIEVPPELLRVMRACLQRDPLQRMTIPQLLHDPLLKPVSLEHALLPHMSQMLSLLKRNPRILEHWDESKTYNDQILTTLFQALHQQDVQQREPETDNLT